MPYYTRLTITRSIKSLAFAVALCFPLAANADITIGVNLSSTGPVSYTHLTLPTKA